MNTLVMHPFHFFRESGGLSGQPLTDSPICGIPLTTFGTLLRVAVLFPCDYVHHLRLLPMDLERSLISSLFVYDFALRPRHSVRNGAAIQSDVIFPKHYCRGENRSTTQTLAQRWCERHKPPWKVALHFRVSDVIIL